MFLFFSGGKHDVNGSLKSSDFIFPSQCRARTEPRLVVVLAWLQHRAACDEVVFYMCLYGSTGGFTSAGGRAPAPSPSGARVSIGTPFPLAVPCMYDGVRASIATFSLCFYFILPLTF